MYSLNSNVQAKIRYPTQYSIASFIFHHLSYRQTLQHHELLPTANIPMAENGKHNWFLSVNLTQNTIVSAPFLVNGFLSFVVSIQEKSCSQSYHSFLTIDSIRKAKREDGTLTTPDLQRDDVSYEPGMFYSGDTMIMQSQKMILTFASGLSS